MLKLYLTTLPKEERSIPEELLSQYRRGKLSRQSNALLHRRSLTSELLLRHALREQGCDVSGPLLIGTGEHGKPFLIGGRYCFNLSDSGELLLCALSDREIGADIQELTSFNEAVVRRFFAPDEAESVCSAADRDDAFTALWTKKESWCKALGAGLSLPLSSFSVLSGEIAPRIYSDKLGLYHFSVSAADGPLREKPVIEIVENGALLI